MDALYNKNMKKISIIIVFTVSLFWLPAFAADQAPSVQAGITPDSQWYDLKIFTEDVWTNILGLLSSDAEIKYLNRRMEKRGAEAIAMAEKNGADSPEFIKALGLRFDYKNEIVNILGKEQPKAYQDYQNIIMGQIGRDEELRRIINASPVKAELESKMNDLRAKLDQAKKSETAAQAETLLKELEKAKTDYSDFIKYQNDYSATLDNVANRAENYFTGEFKAELVLERAAAQAERAKKDKYDGDMVKINNLIAEAKQAVKDAKIKEITNFTDKLQKAMRDSEENFNKKRATDLAKQVPAEQSVKVPAKTSPLPVTLPPQQKQEPVKLPPIELPPVLETIPSETVNTNPLILLGYYDGLQGRVGSYFSANFGGQGGLPPYYYKLETGVGFPPMGLILDVNGRLSGTPSAAGTSNFGVCVIDTAGKSECATFRMVVAAAVVIPPPAQVEIDKQISVASQSSVTNVKDQYGRPMGCYAYISGTASGPIGAIVFGNPISDSSMTNCGSWNLSGENCVRSAGQPEQTNWAFRISGSYPGSGDLSRRSVSVSVSGDTKFIDLNAISCSTR